MERVRSGRAEGCVCRQLRRTESRAQGGACEWKRGERDKVAIAQESKTKEAKEEPRQDLCARAQSRKLKFGRVLSPVVCSVAAVHNSRDDAPLGLLTHNAKEAWLLTVRVFAVQLPDW